MHGLGGLHSSLSRDSDGPSSAHTCNVKMLELGTYGHHRSVMFPQDISGMLTSANPDVIGTFCIGVIGQTLLDPYPH